MLFTFTRNTIKKTYQYKTCLLYIHKEIEYLLAIMLTKPWLKAWTIFTKTKIVTNISLKLLDLLSENCRIALLMLFVSPNEG